jgi:hypothetical protein
MPALDQWEKRLKPYFSRRLLMVGEIPISRSEMEDIASGVRGCIQRQGLSHATEILDSQFPYTYLVFLTAFGAFNIARDYWGALGEEIGTAREHLFNHRWHHRYLEKIKKLGMRYFAEEDSSTPYVTTIRYHGGIPVYSLADYFRRFVLPAVDRPELTEVSARQALDVLIRTAYNVDSPVINFLENSGALGESFFEACCELARHYRQYGEVLHAGNLDLPERVVQAFEAFIQEELLPAEGELKLRLRKPVLLFTAETTTPAHLYVRLPEQEIPLRFAEGRLEWRVGLPGISQNYQRSCQTKMRRQHMIIDEDYLPVDAAPQSVQVALVFLSYDQPEVLLKRWPLPLMTTISSDQVLAFRADGTALRSGEPLPAEEVLLVYPVDVELKVEGVSGPSHHFGNLFDAWAGWQANGWDLSQAWSVQMLRDGHPVGMSLSVAGKLPAPELLGEPFQYNADPGGTQLYIGHVPTLRVPLRPDIALNRELARWRLEIRSSWSAQPEIQESLQLVRIQDSITTQDGWAHIPMSIFLGSAPVGSYSLCLSSPFEDDIDFRFLVWPKLTLVGLKRAIFPTDEGSEVQTLTLIMPDDGSCEMQTGAEGLDISHKAYGWEVIVAPEAIRADLDLIWERADGDSIRVPIYIPVPRLRWALALDQEQGQLQWTTRLIQRPSDHVLQSETGALHIAMPGLEAAYNLALEVVDVDSGRVRQSEPFQKTPFAPDWLRLSLAKLRDTLRHAGSLARLDLVYQSTREEEEIGVPLLLLSRQLEVSNVELQSIGELRWRLTWKQRYPVRNRRLLFQPAWQPWQDAWEFQIPDQADTLILSDIGLISARYQLHFYTAPKDDPALKSIPPSVPITIVDLCIPDERLAELEEQSREAINRGVYETAFRTTLEAACIYEDLGQPQPRDTKLSELAKSIIHISSLQLLLGFFRWLDDHQIQTPYNNFFRRYMFKPELVRQILSRYRKDNADLRAYLLYVPQVRDVYAESAFLIARHSDNPAILSACLQRLVQQEDEKLVPFIADMISAARLSNLDAIDLLGQKPDWAMKATTALPPSPTTNQLLADLLIQTRGNLLDFPQDEKLVVILRAFPYIRDRSLRYEFMKRLLQEGRQEAYQVLMQAQQGLDLEINELVDLLAIEPKLSIKILSDLPETEIHQTLLNHMIERFPAAAGIISPGTRIKTPGGIALITMLETQDGERLTSAKLWDAAIRIHMVVGEGVISERLIFDSTSRILRFLDTKTVIACGNCNFAHPNRRVIDQHHRTCHPYQSLKMSSTSAQITVDINEMEIIE